MPPIPQLIRALVTGIVAMVASAGCNSAPPDDRYQSMVIDPETLHMDLVTSVAEFDDRAKARPIVGSYYQLFVGQGGGTSIDHYFQPDPSKPRVRYGHFESGYDRLLSKSIKARAMLQGSFGTVYSLTSCYYNLPVANYRNSVQIYLYANAFEHEPPTMSAAPPTDSSDTVTNLSIIRVLRRGPEYLVVTALYLPSGPFIGMSVQGSRNGDWVHPSNVDGSRLDTPRLRSGGPTAEQLAALERYGLPGRISIDEVSGRARPGPLPSPGFEVDRDVFNVHYDSGQWIRQDEFLLDGLHQRRYLIYARTPDDAVLHSRCGELLNQQQAEVFGR